MQITFVNHASFIICCGSINLIIDPWFEGAVFDNGWQLISPSQFTVDDFDNITHIWFSHEHPDHFFPPILKKIPEEVRKRITVLYQCTVDKKVVEFCKGIGFKEVIEIMPNESYVISKDVFLQCEAYADGDSWAYIKIENFGILNLNDCIVRNKEDANIIKDKIGHVDMLFTQFSYANKVGNVDDDQHRMAAIDEKIDRINNQIEVFHPKYVVPFASFVFFCHEENRYMNLPRFPLRRVIDAITLGKNVKSLVLYPGDEWTPLDSSFNSDLRISNYEKDYQRILNYDYLTSKRVDLSELQKNSEQFGIRILRKNPTVRTLFKKLVCHFYVSDYEQSFQLRIPGGLQPSHLDKAKSDIVITSEALAYLLKYEWGPGTCNVNARYLTTKFGDPYRFSLLLKITELNNDGKEYVYIRPGIWFRIKNAFRRYFQK
jgi:UDP-MurNAc hydroxylase